MFLYILIYFCLLRAIKLEQVEKVLVFNPDSLTVQLNSTELVQIGLYKQQAQIIYLNFTYGDENKEYLETNLIEELDPIELGPFTNETKQIKIKALKVGHLVIGATSNQTLIPFSDVFRVDVIHSKWINVLIQIIGWIYFFSWSISFYPQVILNYQLKDVSGLSLDFIFLNLLGHSCYSVFNISFYWISQVEKEYFKLHPRGVNPVLLNDVLFSIHAVLLTLTTVIQCLIYKKAEQKISLVAKLLLAVMISFLAISAIICVSSKLTILNYIYFFSYVKLAITIMKYIPQAYVNYKRKSTVGWSIINVLLDFTGGSLSLLQMFFLAYNYNDWSSIFGSPTKLGLGLLSILFDIIFMLQHYVFYKNNSQSDYTPIS